jgi:hypothetical protein
MYPHYCTYSRYLSISLQKHWNGKGKFSNPEYNEKTATDLRTFKMVSPIVAVTQLQYFLLMKCCYRCDPHKPKVVHLRASVKGQCTPVLILYQN